MVSTNVLKSNFPLYHFHYHLTWKKKHHFTPLYNYRPPPLSYICKSELQILCLLFLSAARARSLDTPSVHTSYSRSLRHSNSTSPRKMVFSPKYLRCSPPSSRWRPGQAGISLMTSSTTSAKRNGYHQQKRECVR